MTAMAGARESFVATMIGPKEYPTIVMPKAATLSQSSPRMSIPTSVTTPMTPIARPSARDLLIRSSMPMRQPITAARMGTAAIKIAVTELESRISA